MENKQTALAKLKEVAMKYFNVTEIKLMEVKTKDGNSIMVDGEKMDVGVAVMVVDEAGEKMPVPDGDLVLEDGSTITVKDGLITAIVPAGEEVEDEASEETKLSKLEQQIAKLNIAKEIAIHKDAIDSLKAEMKNFADLKAENETLKAELEVTNVALAEQKKFVAELFAYVEKIADEPSATSNQVKKDGFANTPKKSLAEQMKEVRQGFKNLHSQALNN